MNFISKNLKKAGIFNSILILIATILCIINLFTVRSFFGVYVLNVSLVASLVSGMIYSCYGYKKDVANYYKGFMVLFFIAILADCICEIPYLSSSTYSSMISTIANFARLIPLFLLAFVKDFGKKRSTICAYLVFALGLFILCRTFIFYSNDLEYITIGLSEIASAAVGIILVNEKYADKESRGAK